MTAHRWVAALVYPVLPVVNVRTGEIETIPASPEFDPTPSVGCLECDADLSASTALADDCPGDVELEEV